MGLPSSIMKSLTKAAKGATKGVTKATKGVTKVTTRAVGADKKKVVEISKECLVVVIVAAKNLPGINNDGKSSDSYCLVEVVSHPKQKTKMVTDTLNPLFESTFTYPLFNGMIDGVILTVKHDNITKDNVVLGMVDIPTDDLKKNQPLVKWYKLDSPYTNNAHILVSLYHDVTRGVPALKEENSLVKGVKTVAKKTRQVGERIIKSAISVCVSIILFSARLILHHLERKKWVGFVDITIEAPFLELTFEISTKTTEKQLEKQLGALALELGFDVKKIDEEEEDAENIDEEEEEQKLKEMQEQNEEGMVKEDPEKDFSMARKFCYRCVDGLLQVVKEVCIHMQKRDAHGLMKILSVHEVPLPVYAFVLKYGFAVDTDTVSRDDVYIDPNDPNAAGRGPLGFMRGGIAQAPE